MEAPAETPKAARIPDATRAIYSWITTGISLAFWFWALPLRKNSGAATFGNPTPFWEIVRYLVIGLVIVALVLPLTRRKAWEAWSVFHELRLSVVLQACFVIAVTLVCAFALKNVFPLLDRSWLHGIPINDGHATNIILLPFQLPLVGGRSCWCLRWEYPISPRKRNFVTERTRATGRMHCREASVLAWLIA